MPVTITTTKEERVERLVSELREAGLHVTHISVEPSSYESSILGGPPRMHGLGQMRANIELVAISRDAYELLQYWIRQPPMYR